MKENTHHTLPSFIYDNLDILHRFKIINAQQMEQNRKKRRIEINYFEKNLKENGRTDFLILFGHHRNDYELLLYPVANDLVNKGVSVSVFVPNSQKSSHNLSILSPKVKVIFENQLNINSSLKKKKDKFTNKLLAYVNKWSRTEDLNQRENKWLRHYYRIYALDQLKTYNLCQMVKPSFILGIHYILNPGYFDLLRYLFDNKINIGLIQHGFMWENIHDFRGVDLAILWGEYHQKVLNTMNNPPRSVVLGNPKIESSKNQITKKQSLVKRKSIRILYIFSESPIESIESKHNFELFLNVINKNPNQFHVTLRLHPRSSIQHLNQYLKTKVINSRQISCIDLFTDINQNDIIVGDYSTAVFEAAAFNKPVIQLFHKEQKKDHLLLEHTSSEKQLSFILNKLSSNQYFFNNFLKKQSKVINQLFYNINQSTERISNFLINEIQKNN